MKIIKFQVVLVPTIQNTLKGNVQTAQITIWGLGDDNKMYQWDSKEKKWVS